MQRMTMPLALIALLLCNLSARAAGAVDPNANLKLDLRRSVVPLIDLAIWCGQNKAKSEGAAALDQAKAIIPDAPMMDDAAKILAHATDESSGTPPVTEHKRKAYAAAAKVLEELATHKHAPGEDAQYDGYLLKAIELTPNERLERLAPLIDKAIKSDRLDDARKLYVMGAGHIEGKDALKTWEQSEKALAEKGALAATAKDIIAKTLDGTDPNRHATAGIYLSHIAGVDPKGMAAGEYRELIARFTQGVFLMHTPLHQMVAYVSVPKNWNPAQKTPILVCFAGAGREHESICGSYRHEVGDDPFIVISCVTFSNTNEIGENDYQGQYPKEVVKPFVGRFNVRLRLTFDLPGALAMIKTVHEAFNGEDKIYITGTSGGGSPCYGTMLDSPGLIAAAAPACANFFGGAATGRANAVPVQQFNGEKDQYNGPPQNLLAQDERAAEVLRKAGFVVAEREMVPGQGHSALVPQVVKYFKKIREAAKTK